MIVGKLDLGSYQTFKMPERGIHTGIITIPGGYAFPYGDHSDPDGWRAHIWIKAPAAVGQYSAGTQGAAEFLSRQLEELARNPDQQPVYVQLYAGTGVVAHSPAFSEPQDGFYYLNRVKVDYTKSQFGFTIADLDLQYVSPGPPRTIGMAHTGAALSTGFSGGATNWLAYPLNSTIALADATRTGAEGAVQVTVSPAANPTPFVYGSTVSDWWKDGCQVHDVMATIGTNAVPTSSGAFLNTNWIEAFGKDHRFTGDVILTNGLILWSLALTASPGIVGYVWNTNQSPAQWQQFCTLTYKDVANNSGTLRQVSLQRVSLEEGRLDCWLSTSGNKWAKLTMRLQRGTYDTRLEFTPLSEDNTNANALLLTYPSAPKIVYNSANATDDSVGNVNLATTSDYGYAAAIIANSTYSFIAGPLWQDTTVNQPKVNGDATLGYGDTGGPSQNATKAYGVFAFPFATPQNLQAEGEGGTLGTGWSSVVDAAGSAGNTAKCTSGTLTGNADTFGTAWVPAVGQYDVWFRVKVTSAAGSASEMKLGLYNSTDSAFVSSTTYKANQVTTSYAWYRVATGVTPTATKNVRFRAETTATIGTDWFIDEAALAPITSTSTYSFPQDLSQQYQLDRTTRIRVS